ncbi:MAG: heme-binding domain-containing protein [Flammeovirgaceae bacterium]|nr:heme-binding domain-containing protein [Flammeovirgaceae bacterium]
MIKKILYGLLFVLIVIQFVRPERNVGDDTTTLEFEKQYVSSAEMVSVLKESCYDCHSNNTRYPWYSNIQPIGWWLQDHIKHGKGHLNFSEFLTYPEKKAKHKFEEIEEMVGDDEMPLPSYLIVHRNAKLTPEQKQGIVAWAGSLKK